MDFVKPDTRKALKRIASTDYVHSAILEHKNYIADLEELIADYNDKIVAADREREERLQSEYNMNMGTSEKLDSKGKKNADTEDDLDGEDISRMEVPLEQRERTFDMVYQQLQIQIVRASLMEMLSEAQINLSRLKMKQSRHSDSVQEIANMYQGRSLLHENEELRLKSAIVTAQKQYDASRCGYVSTALTIIVLTKARARLRDALTATSESYSEFLIGIANRQSHKVPIERAVLTQADRMCVEAQILVTQAYRMVKIMQPIPKLDISLSSVLRRYYFDTFGSDEEFRENIMQDAAKITENLNVLEGLEKELKGRKKDMKKEVVIAKECLEEARLTWQIAREKASHDSTEHVEASPNEADCQI